MMNPKPLQSRSTHARRKLRPRGTPKWIEARTDLDEIARRRCLMVLSVLSGERAVTEAIAEAQISRGTYYELEERALKAMIAALMPTSVDSGSGSAETPAKRIAELEAKVTKLEREKRRGERLLLLTRKVLKPGPVTTGAGRPKRRPRASTTPGPKPSRASKPTTPTERASPSTPTPDGEGAR
jgi:hypothetical protein